MDRSMAKTFDKASFKTCIYTVALSGRGVGGKGLRFYQLTSLRTIRTKQLISLCKEINVNGMLLRPSK